MRFGLRALPPVGGNWTPETVAFLAGCALDAYRDTCAPSPAYLTSGAFRSEVGIRRPETDTQGFAAWSDRLAVIAFRGTTNLADWLRNMDRSMVRREWAAGRVHLGWSEAVESVGGQLRYAVKHMPLGVPLLLTGHSLGGALAVLAAAWLEHDGARPAGVCTFGQPMVGNRAFAESLRAPLLRVARGRDGVPILPPNRILATSRWCHAGGFAWLNEGRDASGPGAWRDYSRGAARMIQIDGSLAPQAADHSMEGYYRDLAALCPTPRRMTP